MEQGPIRHDAPPSWKEKLRFLGSFYSLTLLPHNPISRPHWNEIIPGLILGGVPVQTALLGRGNHGEKLINQCKADGRELKLVVSAMEKWEQQGIGPIKTVQSKFWAQNNIEHRFLNMQDFTGDVNLEELDTEVDAIDDAIKDGKTAYVHCKAGRGRSFLVVFCYLMKHEDMNADDALATILKARPQVSPSASQFATIDQYRQEYASNSKPLNIHSDLFYPYRKDWQSYLSGTKTHGVLATVGAYLLLGYSALAAMVIGFVAKNASQYVQDNLSDYDKNLYSKTKALSLQEDGLTDAQRTAVEAGYQAATSHWNWLKSCTKLSATKEYGFYRAGLKAGKEHDEDLLKAIKPKVQ